MSRRVKTMRSLLLIVAGMSIASLGHAQEAMVKVQSLYLYNFAKNIQWSNVSDKYVIGVYANQSVVDGLKAVLAVRQFNGKKFEIKKLSSPADASSCHIVFVGQNFGSTVKKIKDTADLKNTLVVSERGQLDKGAAICFVLQNSKLRFKINEAACKESGLLVSNDLLALGV